MQARRNTSYKKEKQEKEQSVKTESIYCIQLKEILSNSWQGFFEGLEFETVTQSGKEITIMRGSYTSQDEFQKILQQLEEMNLHYQKVTVDTIEAISNSSSRLSTHTWIHELSRTAR